MREIKFRGWHKECKKMLKIGQITLEKGIWNFEPDDSEYIGMSIPYQPSFILMQYTGLHDKNGNEIYEGDIVFIDAYSYEEPEFDGEFRVTYDEGRGMWLFVDLENEHNVYTFEDIGGYYKTDLKIIGNIYENPELLEVSQC